MLAALLRFGYGWSLVAGIGEGSRVHLILHGACSQAPRRNIDEMKKNWIVLAPTNEHTVGCARFLPGQPFTRRVALLPRARDRPKFGILCRMPLRIAG